MHDGFHPEMARRISFDWAGNDDDIEHLNMASRESRNYGSPNGDDPEPPGE